MNMNKNNAKENEQLRRLKFNRRFIQAVAKIRIEYAIPSGLKDEKNTGKWNQSVLTYKLNNNQPLLLSRDVDELRKEFNLKPSLHLPIINYVFFNEFSTPAPLVVEYRMNKSTKQLECKIEIFGDTRLNDIKDAWSEIEKIQKGKNWLHKPLPGYQERKKSSVNLERDAEIRRLRDMGLKLKQIAHKMGVDYSEISNIITRHKRAIGEK